MLHLHRSGKSFEVESNSQWARHVPGLSPTCSTKQKQGNGSAKEVRTSYRGAQRIALGRTFMANPKISWIGQARCGSERRHPTTEADLALAPQQTMLGAPSDSASITGMVTAQPGKRGRLGAAVAMLMQFWLHLYIKKGLCMLMMLRGPTPLRSLLSLHYRLIYP